MATTIQKLARTAAMAAAVPGSVIAATAQALGTEVSGAEHFAVPNAQHMTVAREPVPGSETESALGLELTQIPGAGIGEPLEIRAAVTNTGATALSNLHIDAEVSDNPVIFEGISHELLPGERLFSTARYIPKAADWARGHIALTATVSGTDPRRRTVSTPGSLQAAMPAAASAVQAELRRLAASPDEPLAVGVKATNGGGAALRNVSASVLFSDIWHEVELPASELAPGKSVGAALYYAATPADVARGHVDAQVVVRGTSPHGEELSSESKVRLPVQARLQFTH